MRLYYKNDIVKLDLILFCKEVILICYIIDYDWIYLEYIILENWDFKVIEVKRGCNWSIF